MKTGSIAATGVIVLGDTGTEDVGTWVVGFVGAGGNGSTLVKARVTGSGTAYSTISYKSRSDDSVSAAAITADKIIEINAAGLDIELDVTIAAGILTYYAIPLTG